MVVKFGGYIFGIACNCLEALPKMNVVISVTRFMQQDANECWTELVRCLQRQLQMSSEEGGEAVQVGQVTVNDLLRGRAVIIAVQHHEVAAEIIENIPNSNIVNYCF